MASPDVISEKSDDAKGAGTNATDAAEDGASALDPLKCARILAACDQRDVDGLQALAIEPGGFLSDELRTRAWPVLLGYDPERPEPEDDDGSGLGSGDGEKKPGAEDSWRDLPRHRDEDQVKLDVHRSFVYYPDDDTPTQLEHKKAELSDLITRVLRRAPYLCYFQGYHDICQVFLLVLPPRLRAPLVLRLSCLRIRDFMLPTLAPALAQLRLLPALLAAADPALGAHLADARLEPFFALADTLTMFAHNVRSYRAIARLFDALVAREHAFGLYVFAELPLGDDLDDLDAVLAAAAGLAARLPPDSLGRPWRRISGASALRTARDVAAARGQSLADGRRFFDAQLREMRWAERRDRLLGAVWSSGRGRTVVLAVLVGLGAVYLRRTSAWSRLLAWSAAGFGTA
ncbi:rab-GTPase-TBC domain-containing protein [Xylariaceae sp. FL0804]|nr:rab-GTPase-TBC domain-containing protein [Xylariaceae sp. FL0804]